MRQLKSYKEYENIKRIIQININSYDSYGYGDFVYESGLMLKKYNIEYSNLITIYEINLAYYKNIDYNKIEKGLLKDLALLVIEDKEVLSKLYKGDYIMAEVQKEMKGLVEEVDGVLYYDEEKLQKAIEHEMTEKGLRQGREETAKALLTMGILSIEQIAEVTKLSVEEIEKLKEN